MTNLLLPDNKRLIWYLAAEQYVAEHINQYPDGVFFTWVVRPTVIFGRHQLLAQEVNVEYCHRHGIQIYQRRSGGGCVYADKGNLMLSYIVPCAHSEQVFREYLDSLTAVLLARGFKAARTEHNDIMIGGSKVSGNACYTSATATIVHGTMLFDVDFDALSQAITPSAEKLQKHAVQSVRQRVENLIRIQQSDGNIHKYTDINDLSLDFINALCSSAAELTAEQLSYIDSLVSGVPSL